MKEVKTLQMVMPHGRNGELMEVGTVFEFFDKHYVVLEYVGLDYGTPLYNVAEVK